MPPGPSYRTGQGHTPLAPLHPLLARPLASKRCDAVAVSGDAGGSDVNAGGSSVNTGGAGVNAGSSGVNTGGSGVK